MPGVIMDTSGPHGRENGGDDGDGMSNGVSLTSAPGSNKIPQVVRVTPTGQAQMSNGPVLPNGVRPGTEGAYGNGTASDMEAQNPTESGEIISTSPQWPPELPRVPSNGFYPLATMISRTSQKCLLELDEVIQELSQVDVPQQNSTSNSTYSHNYANGVTLGNQSRENLHKKTRMLEFAQEKRQQFIKLLVISDWARKADEVGKNIDIKVWIDKLLQLYAKAIDDVGQMKRRLATEKLPPPDLTTAIEVLSTGKVARLPDLGLLPRKPLTAKKTLKILKKINVLLSIKINLLEKDEFPDAFLSYKIHDGRVTFTVPTEFDIDLSIADEDRASQFYFVDLRFLFTPSSPIAEGTLRDHIEWRANEILRTGGLTRCFTYLHDLVLTTKIGHLSHLVAVMARGYWTESLRIDYLHRTLVVQYWTGRPGPRSWVEIGIKSGRRKDRGRSTSAPGIPFVDIRWLREKQEVDNANIKFDTENLNFDATLRSVIALHISHILRSMYDKLMEGGMYKDGNMAVKLTTSRRDPLDCVLRFQLTKAKAIKVRIEPVSGKVVLQPPSKLHSHFESILNSSRDLAKEGGVVLSRLRCAAVKEEVEYRARTMGWEVLLTLKILEQDKKRYFPKDMVTFSFLRQKAWKDGWHLLSTHGLSSDLWWVVQIKKRAPQQGSTSLLQATLGFGLHFVEKIEDKLIDPPSASVSFDYFRKLSHVASGMISLHANSLGMVHLKLIHDIHTSETASPSELPYILATFDPRMLPSLLPMARDSSSGPWCDDKIRFSFQGLDPLNSSAKLLAQGHLSRSITSLVKLNSSSDSSVSYEPKTRSFAFHFTVAPGIPVGVALLQRLQRLERLISSLGIFRRFNLSPDLITLGKILFSYAVNLRALIDFDYTGPAMSLTLSPPKPPSSSAIQKIKPKPRMGLEFSRGNPHLRIKEHLISILNGSGGLMEIAFLLKATLPPLQGLEEIDQFHQQEQQPDAPQNPASTTSQPTSPNYTPESNILYRSADWYGIQYSITTSTTSTTSKSIHATPPSRPLCRFDLRLKERKDSTQWLLTSSLNHKNASAPEPDSLAEKLLQEVFSARGPGWRGLDTGAACEMDKVVGTGDNLPAEVENKGVRNLLRTVDRVVREHVAQMVPIAQTEQDDGTGAGEQTKKVEEKGGQGRDDDVITID